MIAIHTKYIGPSNTRGSRIKAYTASSKWHATIAYPYDKDGVECHYEAVKALVKKHGLDFDVSKMCYGDSADSRGYVFVFPQSTIEG